MRRAINLDYRLNPETSGKWVIFGKRSEIGKLWKTTREYVREGGLYEIKFCVQKNKCGLLVYADEDTKEGFYKKLEDLGVQPKWISNEETRKNVRNKRRNKRLVNKIVSFFK